MQLIPLIEGTPPRYLFVSQDGLCATAVTACWLAEHGVPIDERDDDELRYVGRLADEIEEGVIDLTEYRISDPLSDEA